MTSEPEATVFMAGRIAAGTKLNGIYEVERSLVPGGMGEVYKGHEIFSNKKVALKFIRRELEENPDARQMFINEGETLAEVRHDAVVRCYPLSVDPIVGRLYLPMEFVEGQSLFDMMQAGPLSVDEMGLLFKRIASGLQAAHDRGIFHRDVSPDNIIVPGGDYAKAKIIDFGIARSTNTGAVTVIGPGFAGKPNYVSPEQCGLFGGDVRGQSDIYSLGLVLAGALLGRPLDMRGTGSMVDVTARRQRLPDLTGIDGAVRPVLEAMLQPDPARRPASVTAASQMLDEVAAPIVARPRVARPRSRRRRLLWATLGLGVAVLALAAAAVTWPALWQPFVAKFFTPPEQRMQAFIGGYGGNDCVLVTPRKLTATSAELSVVSGTPEQAGEFSKAFATAFGFAPTLAATSIATPRQCPALASAHIAMAGGGPSAAVTILTPAGSRKLLKSGKLLSGVVDAPAGASVALLRVDENGMVQDLSQDLKAINGEWSFQARLDRSADAAPGAQPQLIVALAKPQPLALPDLPSTADAFFPALDGAAGRAVTTMSVAVLDLDK